MVLFNISSIEDLKEELRTAAEVDKSLPKVKTESVKAHWVDIWRSPQEKYYSISDEAPKFKPTQQEIDKWYEVTTNWVKVFQSENKVLNETLQSEWAVIWLKSLGFPSKIIEHKLGMCRTRVWYRYEKGLLRLLSALSYSR